MFKTLNRKIADADAADQFFINQPVQRTHGFTDRHRVVNLVDEVEVKIIGFQPFQRVFRGAENIIVMQMCLPNFGGQEKRGAVKAGNCVADYFFGEAGGVHLGGVDMAVSHFNSGRERGGGRFAVIRRIPRFASAHLPGSESENGHGKAAIEFLYRVHFGNPTDWMKKTSEPSGRFSLEMKPLSKLPRITVERPAEAQ